MMEVLQELDEVVKDRLVESLYALVDAGVLNDGHSSFEYWLDRINSGDSREV